MCQKYPSQNLLACRVLLSPKGANPGTVAAVVLVVQVICHFDQLLVQATVGQSAHVWQTSVCSCHNPGIAIPVVYNLYMLEWFRRI